MRQQLLTFPLRWGLLITCLFLQVGLVQAQDEGEDSSSEEETTEEKEDQKSFSDIIPEGTARDEGLFDVYFVDGKVYYGIPNSELDEELLLVTRLAKIPADLGGYVNAGSKAGEQVIRWQKRGDKILLRTVSYEAVADDELPISKSVQVNNLQPIIYAFDIKAPNQDGDGHLIEVTKLFTEDIPALSGLSDGMRKEYKVSRLDKSRSFIDTIRSYPINVEARQTMTFRAKEPPSNSRTGSITLQFSQSMIKLPQDKMMPRLADDRVGWFTIDQVDYGSPALKADEKEYIRRWRLEPKDPEAYARGELVEPVKPIIYYLDPATPKQFVPYFIQGIEDWNKAFEKAGFKNAIIAREAPTPEEDPDWSPEDARFSTVRYVASETRNAVGPSVSDPRTGEILESDIIWYHNHLRSYRNRYLLETGAANPEARTLNTPEEEIGEMMRRVISHEVGHALGLPHNMKASAAYPVDSLRSGSFTQKYGIATTIMDYARYNYVAQPGDQNIRFIRQLGPYDMYSIEWGYRVIPDATTPEEEKETLNSWIKAKEGDPMYMFGSGSGSIDPDAQRECIGKDAVKASNYGLNNLKIVADNLIDWTTQPGEDYSELEELYGELFGVWSRYVGHVVTNVGGIHQTLKTADQEGPVYNPVPRRTQREAMQFLLDEAFSTPEWLMQEDILARVDYASGVDEVRSLQVRHLNDLLDMGRLQRLIEMEMRQPENAYTIEEMLRTLRKGLWAEIEAGAATDVCRRNLQRAYLERMAYLLTEEQSSIPRRYRSYVTRTNVDVSQSDIRPLVKGELRELQSDIEAAMDRVTDKRIRYHLMDAVDRIEMMLDLDMDEQKS